MKTTPHVDSFSSPNLPPSSVGQGPAFCSFSLCFLIASRFQPIWGGRRDWLIDFILILILLIWIVSSLWSWPECLLTDTAAGRHERPLLHIVTHVKSAFRLCPESTYIIDKSQLFGVQGLMNDRPRHSQVKVHDGHTTNGTDNQKGTHLSWHAFLLCFQSAILNVVWMSHRHRPCRHKMALWLYSMLRI